jgi:uncharacterized protein (TIGR03435 family)
MTWTPTKKNALVCSIILVLLAVGGIVKWTLFPSIKEDYFALSDRSLRQAGSGLVVVRPTRFARSHFNGIVSAIVPNFGKPVRRTMGRNVTFQDLMAAAYGQNGHRVALPSDAPKTNFDFLVTVRARPEQKLQEAIRKTLGFVAGIESRNVDVLALKVENPDLPGLAVSDADKKENVSFNDGQLRFTHVRVGAMISGFEQVLGIPVVDRTGLTNDYDFSVAWGPEAQQQLRNGATARTLVDKILNDWGLSLKPETASVEMLAVRKAD